MTRADLLDQLEGEAAQGWPVPFWPQDVDAARPHDEPADAALGAYIALVAEVAKSGDCEWWRRFDRKMCDTREVV